MTPTIRCWKCDMTYRVGDDHRCGRRARAAVPRRQRGPRPVADVAFGVLWLVVGVAALVGLLVWGVPWRSL